MCEQWCTAKNGGGYTQWGVAKGLKAPCLFMITEVSICCQKKPGGWYTPYTPQYTTVCERKEPCIRWRSGSPREKGLVLSKVFKQGRTCTNNHWTMSQPIFAMLDVTNSMQQGCQAEVLQLLYLVATITLSYVLLV